MLDRIFKMFFTEKKQNKKTAVITVIRHSCLETEVVEIKRQEKQKENLTCLSEYFRGLKGLNLKERELARQTSK